MNDNKYLPLGSVCHGTMRPEDLIPAFLDALKRVAPERYKELDTEFESLEEDDLSEAVDRLFDILNEYCPPYCYFGSHPGDGSDYGC